VGDIAIPAIIFHDEGGDKQQWAIRFSFNQQYDFPMSGKKRMIFTPGPVTIGKREN
jgi:hypothetical protein